MRGLKLGAWLLTGLALLLLGRPEPTMAQAAGAAQYYAAGNQLYAAHNYAQAAQYYSAATKTDPNYALAYQGLGNCFYALGRRQDSLAFYQRALALNPSNAQLSQFVQNLQAQLGGASPAAVATPSALQQGMTLLKQRQFADSIPFFQQAIQDNPNNYQSYYYAGYASAMVRDNKNAALYFALANQKYPNAAIQSMAYRYKASLGPDDQQWVNDQLGKSSQGVMVGGGASKFTPGFGFHIQGGVYNILSDPSDIKAGATAGKSVSLAGQTPAWSPMIGFEPYDQLSQNFEINLEAAYLPAGTLSYNWFNPSGSFAAGGSANDNYQYTYSLSMVNLGLGLRASFGGPDAAPYIELGGELSPVSLAFTKLQTDSTGSPISGGNGFPDNFSGMGFGGHLLLGVDFKLSKEMSLGPYVGFRYLNISSFTNSAGDKLEVDKNSGDVTTPSNAQGAKSAQLNGSYAPLTMDMSGIAAGVNLSLSF
ncbi:MAG TPA: tetratricopeptide repeat protein [bacterium]|nr:tetratricopeptide repeat protein [bacterium]